MPANRHTTLAYLVSLPGLLLVCSLTLMGILLLRYFVLYAGQMTVV